MKAHRISEREIQQMDREDPLREFRDQFHIPRGVIYLDGNSLGPPPKSAFAELEKTIRQEWAVGLITSWNSAGWWDLNEKLGNMLSLLIGADEGEVVVCDSTTINLHKALHAALSLNPRRTVIVAEGDSFPTDLYAAQGVASLRENIEIRLEGVDADSLENLVDESTAAVLVNHIDYRSGAVKDMKRLTAMAHDAGAIAVWDLSHSAGVFPVALNDAGVDFAVGCTYKYLNGGPGAPAYIFAARRHHSRISQPLPGWSGHARPFAFERSFEPDRGIRRFLCGTQPVLSLRALEAGLELYGKVDLKLVRQKSMVLTDLFIRLVESECSCLGVEVWGPRDKKERGSQAALTHEDGYAVMQALITRKVIGDFRMPNILRFGFAPLYIRFQDVWNAVAHLKEVLISAEWGKVEYRRRNTVT